MLSRSQTRRRCLVVALAATGCVRDGWVPPPDESADVTLTDALADVTLADATLADVGTALDGKVDCDAGSACGCRSGQPRCGVTCVDGLRNLYRGEGDALDGAGSHHATQGSAGFASGRVGRAFVFGGNAARQYVTLPPAVLDFGDGDFTVSFWFASSLHGNLLSQRPACWGVPVHAGLDLRLTDGGAILLELWTSAEWRMHVSRRGLNDGAWHHVAIVRDGQTVRLGLDGVTAWTTTIHGALSDSTDTPVYLGVGRCVPGAPGSNGLQDGSSWLDGRIDEVAFLDRALSEEETLAVARGRCAL